MDEKRKPLVEAETEYKAVEKRATRITELFFVGVFGSFILTNGWGLGWSEDFLAFLACGAVLFMILLDAAIYWLYHPNRRARGLLLRLLLVGILIAIFVLLY